MKKAMKLLVAVLVVAIVAGLSACSTAVSSTSKVSLDLSKAIDLSRLQNDKMPADPALKLPTLEFFGRVGQGDGAYWNLETISYCPHTGTHMDAPFHVNSDWGAIETMDPTQLIGPAVVLNVQIPQAAYTITADDLKKAAKANPINEGDAVLIHTGHEMLWPDVKYIQAYPILSKDAAEYLVAEKARFIGFETISPDGPNTDTHQILLGAGVGIVENLTNLDKLGSRCYTIGTFPNIQGATATYVRLLAIPQ